MSINFLAFNVFWSIVFLFAIIFLAIRITLIDYLQKKAEKKKNKFPNRLLL